MKLSYTILAILFVAGAAARAQVVPAVTGSTGLPVSGTLRYDLRYSQTAQFYGGTRGNVQSGSASGELSYANTDESRPFTLTYSGGDTWDISGSSGGSGVFQHLQLSQSFVGRKGTLSLSDNVSYLPQAPTTGFSGIPGVGSLPSDPGQPGQTILTLNTRTLNNIATIGFEDRLNYAWSLSIGGSSDQLRFLDDNGQDSDTFAANATMTRRIDARNSIFGLYAYSRYSYNGPTFTYTTNSLLFGYQRQWSRKFGTKLSAGPVWIGGSGVSSAGSPAPPSSTMFSLDASANYQLRYSALMASYTHGTNSGSGYLLGAKTDNVSASFSREFGGDLSIGVSGSYMRSSSLFGVAIVPLNITGVSNAKYGGAQATSQLGRYISAFASYTAVDQSVSQQITLPGFNANVLNGMYQVIGFGVGYSPREMHFKK